MTGHRWHHGPELRRTHHSLGMDDKKGRAIGAIVVVRIVTVVESGGYRNREADALPIGTESVSVCITAARRGLPFGASQNSKRIGPPGAATDAKVKAEIERRIASMTTRYRKQFGGA